MKRKYLTPRERMLMLERQYGKCRKCDAPIDGTGNTCIAEHWFPVAMGNDQKPDCLLCISCADRKTNGTRATSYGSDKHGIAKVKRLLKKAGSRKCRESRHYTENANENKGGAQDPKMRRKLPSRPFADRPEGYRYPWPTRKLQGRSF